jgi:hypothetical protein
MARKYFRQETVPAAPPITSRLGVQNAPYKDTEVGKLVKASGDSGHVLCAAGDQIDGQIIGVENATSDGFGIGSVARKDVMRVTCDGLQATPGTGTIAIGDQVVCGTVVAKDTALGAASPKVTKSTVQVGAGAPADLTAVGAQLALVASGNIWRVIALPDGNGAVGSTAIIERVFGFA